MDKASDVRFSSMDIVKIIKRYGEQEQSQEYNLLLCHLRESSTETSVLLKHLRRLRDCVSLIGRDHHEQLVGLILKLDWLDRGEELIQEYVRLLLNLVSAHPYYLRACIRMLVNNFWPQNPVDLKALSGKLMESAFIELRLDRFNYVHDLLKAIYSIVPMTQSVLIQLVRESFPYLTRDVDTHDTYTHNLLTVCGYIPSLCRPFLELIVEKMLSLDVRSPRYLLKEDVHEEEGGCEMGSSQEQCLLEESGGGSAVEPDGTGCLPAMRHEEAMRLDAMMDRVFGYMHSACYVKGLLQWDRTKEIYLHLLSVFDRQILRTHDSSHVQFLVFFICSLKKDLFVGFLDYLWRKVKSPSVENVYRQASVCYMASLLARAAFSSTSDVKATLKVMSEWLQGYLREAGCDSLHAHIPHHSHFYSVCQALFYVFCFRSQELLDTDAGLKWAEGLSLQHLVGSKLNPLRVCQPMIVATFASITRYYQLAYCDTIIQRNNRQTVLTTKSTMEAFFPFDPYYLKRSFRWIEPLYRDYTNDVLDAHQAQRTLKDSEDFSPHEDIEPCPEQHTDDSDRMDVFVYNTFLKDFD